jgi:hypothetical protein
MNHLRPTVQNKGYIRPFFCDHLALRRIQIPPFNCFSLRAFNAEFFWEGPQDDQEDHSFRFFPFDNPTNFIRITFRPPTIGLELEGIQGELDDPELVSPAAPTNPTEF